VIENRMSTKGDNTCLSFLHQTIMIRDKYKQYSTFTNT